MTAANDLAVRRALEMAGIVFIDENGGGPGVRLHKQSREKLRKTTIDALQRALEAAGIEFTNGDQPGVRLTKAAAARSAEPGRSAQNRRVAAKGVRGKAGKPNDKKR